MKANHKVVASDEVFVEIPDDFQKSDRILAEDIPLDIFYEDKYLLVVNKLSGLLVHPAGGRYSGTLVNALLHHCETLSDVNSELRAGIVHRLDQDTSGLILVAKDNITHTKLAKQFQKHTVKKSYLAIVERQIEFDEGKVDVPLGKHKIHHEKRAVSYDDSAKEINYVLPCIKKIRGQDIGKIISKNRKDSSTSGAHALFRSSNFWVMINMVRNIHSQG